MGIDASQIRGDEVFGDYGGIFGRHPVSAQNSFDEASGFFCFNKDLGGSRGFFLGSHDVSADPPVTDLRCRIGQSAVVM